MPKRNIKQKRSDPFIQKHEEWLASPAYRDLRPVERCLLEEFQRVYKPGRNGRLSISVEKASKELRCNKDTASRAFYALVEHGFIVLTKGHLWQQRLAREWRLTLQECDGRLPTDDWKRWSKGNPVNHAPKKVRSQNKVQNDPKIGTRLTQRSDQRQYSRSLEDSTNV